jgi:hypothetical protein
MGKRKAKCKRNVKIHDSFPVNGQRARDTFFRKFSPCLGDWFENGKPVNFGGIALKAFHLGENG